MKIYYLLLLVMIVFITCSKSDVKGDLSGKEYVRGRLLLYDSLTQNIQGDYLPNKTINISYADSPDTTNYLFSTKSDDKGYFIFSNLLKDKKYRLYYEEKNGDLYYTATGSAVAPTDSVKLYAQPSTTKQNGIYYTVVDPFGTPVKSAKVCIFSSVSAYNAGSCDASTYSLTTNEFGKAFKFNILKGTYYTVVSITMNNLVYSVRDTLNIADTVVNRTLNLKQTKPIGFRYTVTDSTGGLVSGLNVCVFTSRVLFDQLSCLGSTYQIPVDANGIAQKLDLLPNRYYLFTQLTINNLILIARDSVDVYDKIESGTLVLKKK